MGQLPPGIACRGAKLPDAGIAEDDLPLLGRVRPLSTQLIGLGTQDDRGHVRVEEDLRIEQIERRGENTTLDYTIR